MRATFRFLRDIVSKVIATFIVLVVVVFGLSMWRAAANYTATQGAGTIFASVVIASTHYLANLVCDAAAGQTQCATVKAGSAASIATDTSLVTQLNPNSPGLITGQSNASSGVSSTSSNAPVLGYLYGWNGATWDQLQLDGSDNLKVVSAGSQSNASSAVATSSANATSVTWNYIFNGSTWDQWQGTGGAANVAITGTPNVAITSNSTIAPDPCQKNAKTYVAISQTANTKLFSATSAKKNYICSFSWNGSDAENISLVEGTGSTCGTNTAAIVGATTASGGMNFAANSGIAAGNGASAVAGGANNNFDVCLFQSGSGRVAGYISYVQQ